MPLDISFKVLSAFIHAQMSIIATLFSSRVRVTVLVRHVDLEVAAVEPDAIFSQDSPEELLPFLAQIQDRVQYPKPEPDTEDFDDVPQRSYKLDS